ncbi:hypothetical protein PtA15_10A14 [Puccinia triticina]|uniref:Uncharacterized protein n=1 Tax=Puccinia triticina TaxID=208348 RepID=A0ABY7CXT1_9BASI|nr:uncharacterized protein PtA15_10A14 [Puccinia triticina]WAQ88595.1 hypothetical protein PtA15_10A14 [Puccinia triticina]WAR58677.1 hypothetical protein PtB15_10B15 [Puccinia triticina]
MAQPAHNNHNNPRSSIRAAIITHQNHQRLHHSLPHPSQNPHPAALADNASILTLASSGFSPSLHHQQIFPSDEDASVRALAPSRRESIESLSSRWSNVKSTRTGASIRTSATGFYTGIAPSTHNDPSLAILDPPPEHFATPSDPSPNLPRRSSAEPPQLELQPSSPSPELHQHHQSPTLE